MPNWIEGVLKIRGDREHLLDFLNKGLDAVGGGSALDWNVDIGYEELYVYIKRARIVGSRRGFFESTNDDIFPNNDEICVMRLEAKFAWDVDVDALVALSKVTGVDFRFYGFERGMEFNRDVEIIQGEITRNQRIEFQDYAWECIDPKRGG